MALHHYLPQDRLRALELPPFQAAFRAGCRMVMSAHLLNPTLDPETPATLSAPTLQHLLRRELGFEGVVISDDMEMAAITGLADREPEVAGLAAGLDLLLYNHHPERALAAGEAVARALENGRLAPDQNLASEARIQALLDSLPAPAASSLPPADDLERHARLARECERDHPMGELGRGFEAL